MAHDQQQSRVQLLRLYEKTSRAGSRYFTGKLNGCRVLVFKNDRAEVTDGTEGIWDVYLQPAEDRQQQGDDAGGGARQGRQDTGRQRGGYAPGYAADPAQHPDRPADRGARSRAPVFDDEIPFGGRG